MLSRFPSEAWCLEVIALLNADPDAPAAAKGWSGDFAVIVEGPVPLAVYLGAPVNGQLPAPQFLTVEALEARRTSYAARAEAEVWRALIAGTLDPIAAIVQKRLVVRGDLEPVVARLKYRGLAERWLERMRSGG